MQLLEVLSCKRGEIEKEKEIECKGKKRSAEGRRDEKSGGEERRGKQ